MDDSQGQGEVPLAVAKDPVGPACYAHDDSVSG